MILVPDDQWRWCYDEGRDKLLLDLTVDMQFETAYQAKQLSPSARQTHPFSLQDASYYFHLLECIGELPFSEPERVQLVLNAIAYCRFGKPTMPQSWYFQEVGLQHQQPLLGEVFSLIGQQGHGDFLVIEPGDKASVCLFLGDQLPLADDKCLRQSSVIKVMNNRLVPFHAVNRALMQLA